MAEELAAQIVATARISDEFDERERRVVRCYCKVELNFAPFEEEFTEPFLMVTMKAHDVDDDDDDDTEVEECLEVVLAKGWKIENQIRAKGIKREDETFLVLARKPRRAS